MRGEGPLLLVEEEFVSVPASSALATPLSGESVPVDFRGGFDDSENDDDDDPRFASGLTLAAAAAAAAGAATDAAAAVLAAAAAAVAEFLDDFPFTLSYPIFTDRSFDDLRLNMVLLPAWLLLLLWYLAVVCVRAAAGVRACCGGAESEAC